VKAIKSKKYADLQDEGLLATNSENRQLSYPAMCKLFRVIRKSRHLLQGQPLVLVNSADGEVVEIWI